MAILKTLIFTIIAPGTVTILIPYFILSAETARKFIKIGPLQYVGLVPIVLGTITYLKCGWDFATRGKGTPAPIDPPKVLVALNLYHYVRNPMYIAVVSILLGETVLFGSQYLLFYTALLFLIFHLFVIFYEEPGLRQRFGDSYRQYCARVPRWIPNFRDRK